MRSAAVTSGEYSNSPFLRILLAISGGDLIAIPCVEIKETIILHRSYHHDRSTFATVVHVCNGCGIQRSGTLPAIHRRFSR